MGQIKRGVRMQSDNLFYKGVILTAALFLSVCSTSWAGDGKDELWEISSKMEMPGMPFGMPEHTSTQCIPKGQAKDPQHMKKEEGQECKTTDVKTTGNKVKWRVECTGKDPVVGVGEITHGDGSYSGTVKMSGKGKNGDMQMTQIFRGKRVGNCTYKALDLPKQAAGPDVREICKKALDKGGANLIANGNLFVGKNAPCPEMKTEACKKVRSQSSENDTYELLAQQADAGKAKGKSRDASDFIGGCGLDMAKITKEACQSNKKVLLGEQKGSVGDSYRFANRHCPAVVKAARAQCGEWKKQGRAYTSLPGYCTDENFASDDGASAGVQAKADKEQPGDSDNPASAVLDGAKKLKGMFGF